MGITEKETKTHYKTLAKREKLIITFKKLNNFEVKSCKNLARICRDFNIFQSVSINYLIKENMINMIQFCFTPFFSKLTDYFFKQGKTTILSINVCFNIFHHKIDQFLKLHFLNIFCTLANVS